MYNMVLYLCVLIVFSLHRESLKLILLTDPLPNWFCHRPSPQTHMENVNESIPLACAFLQDTKGVNM
jgi:hypothetical protein